MTLVILPQTFLKPGPQFRGIFYLLDSLDRLLGFRKASVLRIPQHRAHLICFDSTLISIVEYWTHLKLAHSTLLETLIWPNLKSANQTLLLFLLRFPFYYFWNSCAHTAIKEAYRVSTQSLADCRRTHCSHPSRRSFAFTASFCTHKSLFQ